VRVLVTGSAGFIGSHVVTALELRGYDVVKADPRDLGSFDYDALADVRLFDLIVHLGAITDTEEDDGALLARINFELPQQLWRWCVQADVPLIYASSAAVYGNGEHGFHEGGFPTVPLNRYGESKLAFDRWAELQARMGQAPPRWAGLRFFNVYGPGEERKGRMASMVSKAVWAQDRNVPLTLFSHGEQMRDFVYVGDVVAVILWMIDGLGPKCSGLFNVGTGRARSFLDMAHAVGCTRIEWEPMPDRVRARFQHYTRADLTRLRSAGYRLPFRDLAQGVDAFRREAA